MHFFKFSSFYVGLLALLVLSACSEQDGFNTEAQVADLVSVMESKAQQRSEAEAKAEVQLFMEQMAPQVRGKSYTITCADYVLNKSVAVRSGDSASSALDTLLYVFNVNNEKTAIVSGDLYSPAVLAVMEGKASKKIFSQSMGTGFDGMANNILNYVSSNSLKSRARRFSIS